MSKLSKRPGGGGVKKGEAFRSDYVRAVGVGDPAAAIISSPPLSSSHVPASAAVAPLAGYDTDTASSFSSLLSAADFPPPPTPWMQSLEERQRSPNAGVYVNDSADTLEVFHTVKI